MAMNKPHAIRLRKRARLVLQRVGSRPDIKRPDEIEENAFGKKEDTDRTYTDVGSALAFRSYGNGSDLPELQLTQGGRLEQDTPNIVLPYDTPVQEDDELLFDDGKRYKIKSKVSRQTHYETNTTLLTDE